MSKTFKSAFEGSSYRLQVCKYTGDEHVTLWILGRGSDSAIIAIAPSDIPAIMLALGEAVGFTEESPNFGTAVHELGLAIKEQERITAEAKAQAELEAEALELFNAQRKHQHYPLVEDWDMQPSCKDTWLAVARRAREMRAEK